MQIFQEFFAEQILAAQIFDVLIRKLQALQVVNQLIQAGHNGIAAAIRYSPEEHVKICDIVRHVGLKISMGHGNFIKVSQHSQIQFLIHRFASVLLLPPNYSSFFRNCPV